MSHHFEMHKHETCLIYQDFHGFLTYIKQWAMVPHMHVNVVSCMFQKGYQQGLRLK
jgi:hypothetical protein